KRGEQKDSILRHNGSCSCHIDGVAKDLSVSLYDRLWSPRGARCVDEKGGVVRTQVDRGNSNGLFHEQRVDTESGYILPSDLPCQCKVIVNCKNDSRLGVLDQLPLARQGVSSVESKNDSSCLQRADYGQKDPPILRHQDRHPISDTSSGLDELVSKA